ncbi:MAG: hypothetical protein IJW47_01505, partial [Clostridia bacterium]|nr:hypothetical protein [Clostridia bacterium]
PKIKLTATENELVLDVNLNMYCKISDQDAEYSDATYTKNTPLPEAVRIKTEDLMKMQIEELLLTLKQTQCDFLKIKDMLYKYNHTHYSRYKDNYLSVIKNNVSVTVSGQK